MLQPLAIGASLVRLHIVAIAALATLVFGWAFTGVWPWVPAVCVAVDWFVINLLNRVSDLEEDRLNQIPGAGFAASHPRLLGAGCVGLLAASLVVSHLLIPELTVPRLVCHAIGFPYNFHLVPWPGGWTRLKEMYFWKNSGSALIFAVTVFGYPLATEGWSAGLAPDVTWTTVAVTAGFFLLFELSYEVIYDLRDLEGDKEVGVRTYPVVHGELIGARIVYGLIVTSLLIHVVGYAAGVVPWRLVVMALAPILQLVITWHIRRRGIERRDCIGLTWLGAGQLLAYCVWVFVGLPLDGP